MSLFGRVVLAVTRWSWVRSLFTSSWGRRVAIRFVAGESLDDAVDVARALAGRGFAVSLDHLGEHVTDRDLAESARDAYLACIARIAREGLDANISIKLSQLGLGFDDALAAASLDVLAAAAVSHGQTITIDMEDSAHTEATVALYEGAQRRHGNLGIALQAYLHRTPLDLSRLAPLGGHIRLCKGAYDESDDVAYRGRSRVDEAYDSLLRNLMAWPGVKPAVATHDEARIDLAVDLVTGREAPYEFQMLYGVRSPLQDGLVADGHPVRVYVPYGDAWYPYLTRRIAERPANLWFFARALFGR